MIRCRSVSSFTVIVMFLSCVACTLQRPVAGSPSDISTPQDRSAEAASALAWAVAVQGGQVADVPGKRNPLVAIPPSPLFSFVLGGQDSSGAFLMMTRGGLNTRVAALKSCPMIGSSTWAMTMSASF